MTHWQGNRSRSAQQALQSTAYMVDASFPAFDLDPGEGLHNPSCYIVHLRMPVRMNTIPLH